MPFDKFIIPLVGGGIGLYAYEKGYLGGDKKPPPIPPGAPPHEMGFPKAVVNTVQMPKVDSINQGILQKPATGNLDPYGLDHFTSQMGTEIEQELKAKFNDLSSDAKKAGADYLNDQLKLNPPLTGKENYKETSAKVGAAVGGAAAGAVCAYFSFGAAAPVCAIGGAYLGKKVGPVVAEYTKKAVKAVAIKPLVKSGEYLKKGIKKLKFW